MAQANTVRYYTGHECQPQTSADQTYLSLAGHGCRNTATNGPAFAPCGGTEISVVLPISGNNSDTVDYDGIVVRYYFLAYPKHFSCTAYAINSSGTVYASSTLTGATNGYSTMSWSGSTLPNSGSSISNVWAQSIICTIPNSMIEGDGGACYPNGDAFISGYKVDTVGS
jgi:hypothetical protein